MKVLHVVANAAALESKSLSAIRPGELYGQHAEAGSGGRASDYDQHGRKRRAGGGGGGVGALVARGAPARAHKIPFDARFARSATDHRGARCRVTGPLEPLIHPAAAGSRADERERGDGRGGGARPARATTWEQQHFCLLYTSPSPRD